MERPTITITDHLTGETITRPLNDEEFIEWDTSRQEWEAKIALLNATE